MGLHGPHARRRQRNIAKVVPPAWKRKRSRVDRVIAFLKILPITKGILAAQE